MRILLLLFAVVSIAHAEEGGGFADHANFIGSGIRYDIGYGPSINYSRRITSRLLLGASVAYLWDNKNSEGGSLDTAQYFRDEYSFQMSMVDLNATFYFFEDGYSKWGPLVRGAAGHANTKAKGWWGRYDRNPALIIFGDDKRLLESHEDTKEWDSTYVRVGGYYQFCFNVHEGARVSHILEIGAGATYFDSRRTISYTKSNGDYFSKDITNLNPTAEINYYLSF